MAAHTPLRDQLCLGHRRELSEDLVGREETPTSLRVAFCPEKDGTHFIQNVRRFQLRHNLPPRVEPLPGRIGVPRADLLMTGDSSRDRSCTNDNVEVIRL